MRMTTKPTNLTLDQPALARLAKLARKWRCSRSAAVRRMLMEFAVAVVVLASTSAGATNGDTVPWSQVYTGGGESTAIGFRADSPCRPGEVVATEGPDRLDDRVHSYCVSLSTGARRQIQPQGTFSLLSSPAVTFLGSASGVVGEDNICIGYHACDRFMDGSDNVVIGDDRGMLGPHDSGRVIIGRIDITRDHAWLWWGGAVAFLMSLFSAAASLACLLVVRRMRRDGERPAYDGGTGYRGSVTAVRGS